jgi:two-component system response regulator NreC
MAGTRILIADDHAILRSGLRMLINRHPDMEVVAEASDSDEAVAMAREYLPDVAIVDISMPGEGGVRVTEKICEISKETRIIALTMHDDQAYLKAVLTAGASGFVIKRSADTRLIDAIETVRKGQVYIDPAMGFRVMQGILDPAASPEVEEGDSDNLSLREKQVLTLLAEGYTNREAAEKLGLSMRSVETYRSRMAEKLGFQNRVDLVRYAIAHGMLNVDPDDEDNT